MLPHLASRIFGTPLLVHRAKLDVILSALGPRLGIDSPIAADPTELLAAVPAPRPNMPCAVGVAVLPIHGTLVKRAWGLEAASGLTSYQDIGAMLDAALAEPECHRHPAGYRFAGGRGIGSFELARRVREAPRGSIWAVANDAAFSAAYAIASLPTVWSYRNRRCRLNRRDRAAHRPVGEGRQRRLSLHGDHGGPAQERLLAARAAHRHREGELQAEVDRL